MHLNCSVGWKLRWRVRIIFHIFIEAEGAHKAAHIWRRKTACARNPHKDAVLLPERWTFTTPAFAHGTTWSVLPDWLKSHMLWILPLKTRYTAFPSTTKSLLVPCTFFPIFFVVNSATFFNENVFDRIIFGNISEMWTISQAGTQRDRHPYKRHVSHTPHVSNVPWVTLTGTWETNVIGNPDCL